MTDDAIRNALRRAMRLEPNPGLADRMTDHARRVGRGEVEPSGPRFSLLTVAGSLALFAALAAGGVVAMQHRTASRQASPPPAVASQPAIVQGTASASVSQPTDAPSASSAPTATAPGAASPKASASPAITNCQAGDVTGSFTTGGTNTYAAGADIRVSATVTNRSTHQCRVPLSCYWTWRVTDSNGQVVGAGPAAGACENIPGPVLQPGASDMEPVGDWSSAGRSSGSYTISGSLQGLAAASTRVTLIGPAATTTAAPATSTPYATPTPLVP
jgi:hypothetical protein